MESTYDIGDNYVILPSMHQWELSEYICHFGAEKVKPGFKYNSEENSQWETVESLRDLIKAELEDK